MKKLVLSGLALLAFFQIRAQQAADSTAYRSRKLRVEEVNLVSSYYSQDGTHAATTGGIGSEKLTDVSNTLDVKLVHYNKSGNRHSIDAEIGIDHYTSASSDQIDLNANSGASSSDSRIYPSINYLIENEAKGQAAGLGLSASTEFDYQSFGINAVFSKKTKDKSGEFTAHAQAFLDHVKIIKPVELRSPGEGYGTESRNTYAASLSWSQIINKNFQILFVADVISQQGYLSLPFHRVYFNDGSVHQEKLPDTRFKVPLGFRGNYFIGDYVIVRGYYRYYRDDWRIESHTAEIEVPVKLLQSLSVSPFYRFYTQTASDHFAKNGRHASADEFYTSNFDLSGFDSHFLGAGLRYTPPRGIFGERHLNALEIRYGHYTRTTDLVSDIISVNIRWQ